MINSEEDKGFDKNPTDDVDPDLGNEEDDEEEDVDSWELEEDIEEQLRFFYFYKSVFTYFCHSSRNTIARFLYFFAIHIDTTAINKPFGFGF